MLVKPSAYRRSLVISDSLSSYYFVCEDDFSQPLKIILVDPIQARLYLSKQPPWRIGTDTLYLQGAITRSPNFAFLFHLIHSARNAGSNGERITALTATIEAASPVNNTASSNNPRETADNRPPRAISAGMIASIAHKTPVNNPQPSSRAFSAITISDRCDAR